MSIPLEEEGTVDLEVFKNAEVLSISEVNYKLSEFLAEKIKENPAYQMPPLLKKTKDYVEKFAVLTQSDNMFQLRRTLLDTYQVTEYEMGLLLNLMPETVDEATTLIPSLKIQGRYADDEIETLCADLTQYKEI